MRALREAEWAAAVLAAEREAARSEAAIVAQRIGGITDDIVNAEIVQVAAEYIAADEACKRLRNKLVGASRLDLARPAPRLTKVFEDVELRTDERKAAVARNRLYLEEHNYARYREEQEAIAEQQWLSYKARLAISPDAVFED